MYLRRDLGYIAPVPQDWPAGEIRRCLMTKTSPTNVIATTVAIGLASFSGAVATYGLTKFAPGAEYVIAAMGVLFEAGKLTSFAMLHNRMPRALKGALLV